MESWSSHCRCLAYRASRHHRHRLKPPGQPRGRSRGPGKHENDAGCALTACTLKGSRPPGIAHQLRPRVGGPPGMRLTREKQMSSPIAADLSDRADFANSDRGFIGTLEPMVIKAADGRVVWDMDSWGFLDGACPDTVNPSLWRQAQLTARHGLYEVTDGIYQVRGFEMSNMTLVESDHGVIVIDPLISQEVAKSAIALYRTQRGDRAVTAVIYTHAHLDHFGGVLGVVSADTDVPII